MPEEAEDVVDAPCVGQFPRHPRSYSARIHPLHLETRPDRMLVRTVNVTDVLVANEVGASGGGGASAIAPVLLAKVDVEGAELRVLESLLPLLRRKLIANLIVELTPGWWPGGEKRYGCTLEQSAKTARGVKSTC